MTQFLLIESSAPYEAFADLVFLSVERDPFLAQSASSVFSTPTRSVWSVAPPSSEVGALAYDARDSLLAGKTVQQTRLGQLLGHAISRKHRFCMFYADDRSALPAPTTEAGLFAELERQLRAPADSNLEIYVQWSGAGAA
jgi:hypothetical protein